MAQDVKTLPKWAQDRIALLERQGGEAQDRATAMAQGLLVDRVGTRPTDLVVVLREGVGERRPLYVPVPAGVQVRRGALCEGIEVTVAEEQHYGRHALSIRSGTGYLYVTPSSGNHVHVSTTVPR